MQISSIDAKRPARESICGPSPTSSPADSPASSPASYPASQDSFGNYSPIPGFQSALSYTQVRDFAYPPADELHYGVPSASDPAQLLEELRAARASGAEPGQILDGLALSERAEYDYDTEFGFADSRTDDGPPWLEDTDLASPVVTSRQVGDRVSKDFDFSVASDDEIHGRAVALFDFVPENENEVPLTEGQTIWVSYRYGQGWLVAEDPRTGNSGLVPEEYVQLVPRRAGGGVGGVGSGGGDGSGSEAEEFGSSGDEYEEAKQVLPELLQDRLVVRAGGKAEGKAEGKAGAGGKAEVGRGVESGADSGEDDWIDEGPADEIPG